jgi:hypothetical protein
MNKEQQELLYDVYKNYLIEDAKILPNMSKEKMTEMGYMLSKEEFINKCKTDTEFSENWGLKIEERDLSLEERMDYWFHNSKPNRDVCDYVDELEATLKSKELDKSDVPSRLITVTYNDKTIESYE